MAKRYYNLEKETKRFLKRLDVLGRVAPSSDGIKRVNDYWIQQKVLGNVSLSVSGKYGYVFTATKSQYFTVPSNSTLGTGTSDFTYSGWFYTLGAGNYLLLGKGGSEASIQQINNTLVFNKQSVASVATSPTFSYNAWHFFVAWRTGGVWYIQIDNGTVNSATYTNPATNSTSLTIGWNGQSGDAKFNGRLDEITFWKRYLTADEIAYLYNSGAGRSYLEIVAFRPSILTSMVSYWPLSETSGICRDWNGTNHLTAVNNPLNTTGIVEELF